MSLQMKLIVPLLDDNLVREDFDEKNGFRGVFMHDKNRPYLDNHLFLLYDISNPSKENYNREVRFTKHTNIYNTKVVYIDGKAYKIYAYPRINSDIKKILKDRVRPEFIKSSIKIMKFWRLGDDAVNTFLLGNGVKRLTPDWKSVPEYDYIPDDDDSWV